jgi:FtsZ-binding cell division protein ZapB
MRYNILSTRGADNCVGRCGFADGCASSFLARALSKLASTEVRRRMNHATSSDRICVITLGVNGPVPSDHPKAVFQDYPQGVARIRKQLRELGYSGSFLAWDREYPAGSPTFAEARCAFKPFCFLEARTAGCDLVLWLDSSIIIKQPIDVLFELIKQDGYLIFEGGHSIGEYCKDDALASLGIDRWESFRMPSCSACVIGLDLTNHRSLDFLNRWRELACDRVTFPGPKWSGVGEWPQTASLDPRVKGHRSDQLAASVLALRLGMDQWHSSRLFDEYFENDRTYVRRLLADPESSALVTVRGERDALKSERDALRAERDTLKGERDALRAERDTLKGERDALRAERDTLKSERDVLQNIVDTWRRRLRWLLWVRRRLREFG